MTKTTFFLMVFFIAAIAVAAGPGVAQIIQGVIPGMTGERPLEVDTRYLRVYCAALAALLLAVIVLRRRKTEEE